MWLKKIQTKKFKPLFGALPKFGDWLLVLKNGLKKHSSLINDRVIDVRSQCKKRDGGTEGRRMRRRGPARGWGSDCDNNKMMRRRGPARVWGSDCDNNKIDGFFKPFPSVMYFITRYVLDRVTAVRVVILFTESTSLPCMSSLVIHGGSTGRDIWRRIEESIVKRSKTEDKPSSSFSFFGSTEEDIQERKAQDERRIVTTAAVAAVTDTTEIPARFPRFHHIGGGYCAMCRILRIKVWSLATTLIIVRSLATTLMIIVQSLATTLMIKVRSLATTLIIVRSLATTLMVIVDHLPLHCLSPACCSAYSFSSSFSLIHYRWWLCQWHCPVDTQWIELL